MAQFLKSNISFDPVVESINRKFVKKSIKCKDVSGNLGRVGPVFVEAVSYMGGATRTSSRGVLGNCKRNYVFFRDGYRTTAITPAEQARQLNFAKAAAGRNAIFMDLSQVTRLYEMIAEAKNDPSKTVNGVSMRGYTARGWVMAAQYAGLVNSSSYNENKWPTTFDA